MVMFVPFLLAFAGCVFIALERPRVSYALWIATFAVTVAWYFHHATDSLNFSF